MRPYTVYLSHQAHDFVLSRRSADRIKLARLLQGLADNPFQEGLEFVHDSTGRRNEVLHLDRFRIVFWSDHVVDEVKVLKIEVLKPRS